jgi:hypothetical protein
MSYERRIDELDTHQCLQLQCTLTLPRSLPSPASHC